MVHLGVVCEHPSSGTLMVHKSSLIINWQCTNEKLWNLFFLPFCFLSTTCLVWVRRRGGGGGGSFHKEWKYIIAKQSFWIAEGQKNFPDFCKVIQVCMKFVVGEMTVERHLWSIFKMICSFDLICSLFCFVFVMVFVNFFPKFNQHFLTFHLTFKATDVGNNLVIWVPVPIFNYSVHIVC